MKINRTSAGLKASILGGIGACALYASGAIAQTTGYWRYVSYDISPKPEEAPKPMPGRLHEQGAKGGLDIPGGKASISSIWKTDDIDRRPYTMEGSFGISASQTLSTLVPGAKVTLTGSASVSGNSLAAAMPANGRFGVNVDFGDYVFQINDLKISQSGAGKGVFTVPNGGAGAKMSIVLTSYLASNGAFGSKLVLSYDWQAGPPPQNLAAIPTGGGTGATSGTLGTAGSGNTASGAGIASGTPGSAGSSAAASRGVVGPGSGNSTTSTIGVGEPASVARMTLQAGKRKVQQGQIITVPVWLIKAQSVANMNFNVRHDPNIAKASNAFSKGNMLDKSLFEVNPTEPGIVRVGFAQNADLSGDGTVAQLAFQANGPPGTRTPLTLEVTTISGAGGGKPEIDLIHGEILVVGKEGTVPGDSDGDDEITARDAGDALKMSVQLIPVKMICDVDNDGQVTSTDARLILAKASGK
jgi:hypothetical protein